MKSYAMVTREYRDYKCEWDVPKFCDLKKIPEIKESNLYEDPEYAAILPNFGFFKLIK